MLIYALEPIGNTVTYAFFFLCGVHWYILNTLLVNSNLRASSIGRPIHLHMSEVTGRTDNQNPTGPPNPPHMTEVSDTPHSQPRRPWTRPPRQTGQRALWGNQSSALEAGAHQFGALIHGVMSARHPRSQAAGY